VTENEISGVVLDASIEVHRTLGGPGLLEKLYEEALAFELELRGLKVEPQRAVPVVRLMDLRLGLVVNFGQRFAKDGFHRVANGLQE